MAGKKMAEKKTTPVDGADVGGIAASISPNQQLVIELSDRRLLFFSLAPMSSSPKDLVAKTELSQAFDKLNRGRRLSPRPTARPHAI